MILSKSNYLQRPHLQIPSHWGLGLPSYEFGGEHNAVHSTCYDHFSTGFYMGIYMGIYLGVELLGHMLILGLAF